MSHRVSHQKYQLSLKHARNTTIVPGAYPTAAVWKFIAQYRDPPIRATITQVFSFPHQGMIVDDNLLYDWAGVDGKTPKGITQKVLLGQTEITQKGKTQKGKTQKDFWPQLESLRKERL
jgi:hypothetical protein